MTSVNDVTGDRIVSKSSEDYRNNWDKIFGKKELQQEEKPLSKPIVLSNKIQCNRCGDIIESKHVHDFVMCSCGSCATDGGTSYMRSIGTDFIDLSEVTSEEEENWFEKVRETFEWGSYGPKGDQPKHYIKLKDMTTEHLQAILDTQHHIKHSYVEEWFKLELEYRKEQA